MIAVVIEEVTLPLTKPLAVSQAGGLPRWRLTAAGHRNVVLQPDASVGAASGAVRTMFPNRAMPPLD